MSKNREVKTGVFRETSQQQLILNFLLRSGAHLTAEDIFAEVKKNLPKISLATVYRNLKKLEDHNLIVSLSYSKGQTRYEFGSSLHPHFICLKCDDIVHVDMDEMVQLNAQISKRHGVQVEYHKMYFFGLCLYCSKKKS